ncbi:hypothetical protein [Xanthomonas campestris]|uniref:hypothetical protein n=1 Tax=Xanthomonas campestris TaxID=339 RepID=UPI00021AFB39|nr:hypothetical protein [Xanthomonas campestris]AEL07779.1 conserved hypothetical protein [Xanthomonas campestris pv. raphani 756C]MEA9773858.1 hypothetical protein [Xanthomonas campestris pv. raphani]MEA9917570.1 hypothetical protein [Xanthomonas campestris pv. raphani]
MPIVFVHGVNNRREDADYDDGVERMRGFLQNLVAPQIGIDPAQLTTYFPYWGGNGVQFRWKQASLPKSADIVETLSLKPPGPGSADLELWLGEARHQYGPGAVSLGGVSRDRGFEEAVDLAWDTASAVAPGGAAYGDVIEGYLASLAYVKDHPAPAWAMTNSALSNNEFIQKLLQEIQPYRAAITGKAVESLGLKDWFHSFKESLSRLGSAPGDAVSAIVTGLGRQSLHEKASRFLGDIFVYLSERGTQAAPGPIVQQILADLDKAQAARRLGDDKLVVIGHSLGGVILYDIVTYFRPDLAFDLFVSVGSQIAVFEEMTLYRASRSDLPPNPPKDRLSKPKAFGRWLNVYDTNDVFSFRAQGVFDGPDDYRFDTGYGLLQAHGGYFARPSFYKRLAVRLS